MWTRRVLLLAAILFCRAGREAGARLVGLWSLDEGSGTVAKDSSGGGHDGQLLDGPQWVAGMIGGALELDGIKARVDIPYWSEATPTTGMTMACWVLPKDTGRACLFGQFEGYGMALMTGLQLKSVVWGGDWVLDDVTLTQDEWSHVVMTWDVENKERLIFRDGEQVGQRGDCVVPSVQNDLGIGLWIGWPDAWGDDSFTGVIDDVRLYNLVLSTDQVAGLYSGVAPTFLKASKPSPADGAIGVAAPLLTWTKGETAAFHNVYLGTSPELTDADLKAARQPVALYFHVPGFTPGATYYWRIDEIEKDGVTIHTGDVWTFVAQDLKAYYPTPADGANDASPAPTLTWMPGTGTVKHHLYFSDSADAVGEGAADADQGELTDTTFTPAGLEPVTTYYWRVDELVAGGTTRPGDVWSFTTYLPVEDFESYTDEDGSRIYQTWIDGWVNGTGSTVGYIQPPFAEQTIVHGGLQSMPLDYNNVNSPFYSEAQREFTPAQDWTINDANTLVLYVRGRTDNDPAQLYLAIADTSNHVATLIHRDPAVITTAKWTAWKIPTAAFAGVGVNMAKVKRLSIGLSNQDQPAAGGTGLVYLDDIYVVKSKP